MIKAIVFDIGQTLTYYPFPLNWSKLYRPAFESVSKNLGIAISDEEYDIKRELYSFFRTDVEIYPEAEAVLEELKEKNILTAMLSDVQYGMDNEYALMRYSEKTGRS